MDQAKATSESSSSQVRFDGGLSRRKLASQSASQGGALSAIAGAPGRFQALA
jgi:hypothetical protein